MSVVHHLVLCKLKPEVSDEKIEWMMRQTRMRLLKIPEVRSIRCGKRIEPNAEWPFFLAVDVDNREKLAMYQDDPNHLKFCMEVLRPNTTDLLSIDYEMDPFRDVRYS